jgi:hypothetical protein
MTPQRKALLVVKKWPHTSALILFTCLYIAAVVTLILVGVTL